MVLWPPSHTSGAATASSPNQSNAESSEPISPNSPETTPEPEPTFWSRKRSQCNQNRFPKLSRTEVSGESTVNSNGEGDGEGEGVGGGGTKEEQVSVKVTMEKAKEYKMNIGAVGGWKSDTISLYAGFFFIIVFHRN